MSVIGTSMSLTIAALFNPLNHKAVIQLTNICFRNTTGKLRKLLRGLSNFRVARYRMYTKSIFTYCVCGWLL
jgi:hypothetical protein